MQAVGGAVFVTVLAVSAYALAACVPIPSSDKCQDYAAFCVRADAGDAAVDASDVVVDQTSDVGIESAPTRPDSEAGPATDGDEAGRVVSDANAEAADAGDGSDGFVCDASRTPSQDPCVVSDDLGVFVSISGSDGNPGSQSTPVATIGRGMVLAKAAHKRVYVCSGEYAENLVVDASRDGVSVYGGLSCATWTYDSATKAAVAPATGYALELSGVVLGVTFEDMLFEAQDAAPSHAGESSVAVFAHGSSHVVFRRSALVAGMGSPGAPGASGGTTAAPSNHYAASLDGTVDVDGGGAAAKTCTCPDGKTASTGGQGGMGLLVAAAPGDGLPAYPNDAGAGAAGINNKSCSRGGVGTDGLDGPPQAPPATMTGMGTLTATGWVPGIGAPGVLGNPGQGGGGGGDGPGMQGSGGGGACGGCGGAAGLPGGGGGSSIALLSYQSSISLVNSTLTANTAGRGGSGGAGEAGQAGGFGGSAVGGGCPGGAGGAGSGGGGAQGGPGGLSLGIGYSGMPPTMDGAAVTQAASLASVNLPAAGGAGGPMGNGGAVATANAGQAGAAGANGSDGVARAVLGL